MPQRKKILEDLEALQTIKNLAQSYEEVAVVRMQQLKDSVLHTRDYLADLSDVFVDLKSSYEREVKDLMERRKKGDHTLMPTIQKNGKTVIVYLASNGKLYGSVTQKTFRLFMQDITTYQANTTDIVVIGAAGKELIDNSNLNRPYDYFDIPDTTVDIKNVKKMLQKFLQYEKVLVYYGKFGNVVTQAPISTSISGDDIFETEVPAVTPREDRFIFEPELEKIFHFFETQIMANLFSQTLLENQLAKNASRVNAMEEALAHIQEEEKKLDRLKNTLKHQTQNKKQLETMAGVLSLV